MEIILKISDFKRIDIGRESYNYYLKLNFADGEC